MKLSKAILDGMIAYCNAHPSIDMHPCANPAFAREIAAAIFPKVDVPVIGENYWWRLAGVQNGKWRIMHADRLFGDDDLPAGIWCDVADGDGFPFGRIDMELRGPIPTPGGE